MLQIIGLINNMIRNNKCMIFSEVKMDGGSQLRLQIAE